MADVAIRYGDGQLVLSKSPTLIALRPARREAGVIERTVANYGGVAEARRLGNFQVVNVERSPAPAEEALDQLRQEQAVEVGSHVYHTSNDGVPFVPTGSVYIVFDEDAPLEECQRLIDEHHLEIVEVRGEREIIASVTAHSVNPVKTAASLQQSSLVAIAEPELATPGKLTAFVFPTDNLLARQWHLRNTGELMGSSLGLTAGADARVLDAWQAMNSLGAREVVVAVIDDGFDLTHTDLTGPGKVVAPWDFTRNSPDPRPEFNPGYPFFDTRTQSWQGDWHGTACAGVAVGEGNGSGIVGSAPDCRLMPVRWGVDLADREIENWFAHVRDQGAWVVSCSWSAQAEFFQLGTRRTEAIRRCAREGRNGRGTVICFAAGNENRDINNPAQLSVNGFAIHPDVVAVAACTSRDERSHYSNFGKEISICAPSSGSGGLRIFTADVTGTFMGNGQVVNSGYSAGDFTDSFGGTSSSTPLVAGICALLLSINPNLTAVKVKEIIQATARKIGPAASYDANGHSVEFGYGCIDAAAAVQAVLADAGEIAPAMRLRRAAKRQKAARRKREPRPLAAD